MTPSTTNVHIAREKVFVFNRIAASLGAKTITLKSSTIESRRGGLFARGKTSPGQVAAQVGIEAQFDEPNKLLIQTQSKLGIPKSDPSVPAEIERWVFADPALENLVKTRLESDLLQQSVTLELSETSQYAGSAVAKYANLGFEVAGRYQSLLRSLWHYEVEFWPKGRK